MSSFFSGTDLNTLQEEGTDRNHFVSLIVNNKGTYTAAVTRRIKSSKTITDNYTYSSFDDKVFTGSQTDIIEDEKIEYYPLTIEFEKESFYNSFTERLNNLRRIKENRNVNALPITTTNIHKKDNLPIFPVDKKDSQQNSGLLFDYDYIDNNINDNIEEESIVPYDRVCFNEKIIQSLVLQIITGSIILSDNSKIDAKKWTGNMVSIFEKRFGKDEAGLNLFRTWAEGYLEYLCLYTEDEKLMELGLDDDILIALCAHDIIKELSKLPTNKYIKIYINILEEFLL